MTPRSERMIGMKKEKGESSRTEGEKKDNWKKIEKELERMRKEILQRGIRERVKKPDLWDEEYALE